MNIPFPKTAPSSRASPSLSSPCTAYFAVSADGLPEHLEQPSNCSPYRDPHLLRWQQGQGSAVLPATYCNLGTVLLPHCLYKSTVTNADRMWLRANYACGPRQFSNTFSSWTQIKMEDYFFLVIWGTVVCNGIREYCKWANVVRRTLERREKMQSSKLHCTPLSFSVQSMNQ